MTKRDFAVRVARTLRENDVRKPVPIKKHTFRITDDEGTDALFHIKRDDKEVLFTNDDVLNVLDACLAVIRDCLESGEEINMKGFGRIALSYRKPRKVKRPETEDWYEVPGHYVPKFTFGSDLRMAGKVYELRLADRIAADDEVLDSDGED